MDAAADGLNLAFNIITIVVLAILLGWLTRWERLDRKDHRAVARPLDRSRLEIDSIELSRTLIEVRRVLAKEREAPAFVAEYLDGVRDRATPDERPPLHSV